jgi:chemotaxis protein CheD
VSARLPIATNLYFDAHFKRPGVKLLPNEFYVTSQDMVLVTVLGSCVAACIQDRTAGLGGMNHFMLPDDGADASRAASESMRYGSYAMEVLLNELLKNGARRERLEAKVFGGAAVLAGMTTLNIGDRNSEFVRRYLALEKVRITAEDLQGEHPRKVAFMPRTGQVMVRKLGSTRDSGVTQRERQLVSELSQPRGRAAAGQVELFGKPAPRAAGIELFSRAPGAGAAQPASREWRGKTLENA